MKLRFYQEKAVADALQLIRTPQARRAIVVLPTGTGKTLIMKTIKEKLGGGVVVLAPRGIVSRQNREKIGVRNRSEPIRAILIDEAHRFRGFKESVPSLFDGSELAGVDVSAIPVIGFTATPYRLEDYDGGLLSERPNIWEIGGFWGNATAWEYETQEELKDEIRDSLCGVQWVRGDIELEGASLFSEGNRGLFFESNCEKLARQFCKEFKDHYRQYGLIFVSNKERSAQLKEAIESRDPSFRGRCFIYNSSLSKGTREKIMNEWKAKGGFLIAIEALSTGFDYPPIDFIGVARYTASKALATQMLGRGKRLFENKLQCLVVDCANWKILVS